MLQQGSLFDNRYELTRFIGRGGFAEVWLVNDTLTGLEEALKIYAPGSGMDEDGLKVFVKELSVVHDLRHTNLLTPKILAQYDYQPYLVLPYCPNGSLNKKINQCTEDDLWKIMAQVASGLAYLHKRKIVHQDIKPDNILVDAEMDYVITDFGISLRAQSTLRKSMHIADASSGTTAYMAPERFTKEPHPIPANDIWSLGAMMFELLEGDVPFMAQLGGLAQKNGAEIPTMHAPVSDALKEVILSMLALNPNERPTADELADPTKKQSKDQRVTSPKESSAGIEQDPRNTRRIDEEKLFQVHDAYVVDSEGGVHPPKKDKEKPVEGKETKRVNNSQPSSQEPKNPAEALPRFCRNCGNPLKPGVAFCNKCGMDVKKKNIGK